MMCEKLIASKCCIVIAWSRSPHTVHRYRHATVTSVSFFGEIRDSYTYRVVLRCVVNCGRTQLTFFCVASVAYLRYRCIALLLSLG